MTTGTTSPTSDRPIDLTADVAVVGGGLAGLTAAAYAARNGATVLLLDARRQLGGRARTTVDAGFHFNEGPHALFDHGAGQNAVRGLGIVPAGARPPTATAALSMGGRVRHVPPPPAAAAVASLIRRLGADHADPAWVGVTARQWIDERIGRPDGRALAAALVRITTYTAELDRLSADAAIAQVRSGLKGVTYLHGGWGRLVAAIEQVARDAGTAIVTGKATGVARDGDRWTVEASDPDTGDLRRVVAGNVVLAGGGPTTAAQLAGDLAPSLREAEATADPVHAACLDLGLRGLTRRSTQAVLGVDRPTYASVHTAHARLAEDGHVLHVMRYEPPAECVTADLEAIADEAQPGWRDEVAAHQIGLRRVVAFDRPKPGLGLVGRPGAVVPEVDGLFLAGDWVGPHDMLGSASLASGRAAGTAAARRAAAAPELQRA